MTRVVRTVILCAVLCGLILAGYVHLRRNLDAAHIAELEALNAEMAARLAQREAMLKRLSRSHRIAHVDIMDQRRDENGEILDSTIRLIELDSSGSEIARQMFNLPGDVLFIDAWTVKFDPEDVGLGHPLRGKTLVLLRRIYSDRVPPREGRPIDTPGAIPPCYAATEIGRFEQMMWENFWEIARNPGLAAEMGIRVAQGEAVYKPVREGDRFELVVDAAGGINLTPLPSKNGDFSRAGG